MAEVALSVKKRETGKQISKDYRRQGLVPGVFYSNGQAGLPILTNPMALRPIVYSSITKIVELTIEGDDQSKKAVLKDISFDPVTEDIVHFDLMGLTPGKNLTIQIPIKLVGSSKGVMGGGVLSQFLFKVPITATPENLPENIEIDITDLGFGESFKLDKVKSDKYAFDVRGNLVICACKAPRVSTEDEAGTSDETSEDTEE